MRRELVRFADAAAVADWFPIDDRVMGGVSQSGLAYDAAGHAVFAGEVSLAHGGGFASVRSRPCDFGAPDAGEYRLEACGDGRTYKLGVRMDDARDGVTWQAPFRPAAGEWGVVRLPLAAFEATWRGRRVPGAPPLDPARVRQFGLVIADRQAGPFALRLRSLAAA